VTLTLTLTLTLTQTLTLTLTLSLTLTHPHPTTFLLPVCRKEGRKDMYASTIEASLLITVAVVVAMAFAVFQFNKIAATSVPVENLSNSNHNTKRDNAVQMGLSEIHQIIDEGANAFLYAEYRVCFVFLVVVSPLVLTVVGRGANDYRIGTLTMISFLSGGLCSILSGYIGMKVAVFANVRTTINAISDGEFRDPEAWTKSFNTAFQAGGVMGFALSGLALGLLFVLMVVFNAVYDYREQPEVLFECIAGYGLGGSCIALFGRVGGGIYTKAADVGADLVGKVVIGIPEDDPRNPAVIADNVGDNVGDVAGMGADLFGSFAEATCAALLVASYSPDIVAHGWGALCFPLLISAQGILVCLVVSFYATDISPVLKEADVETVLKNQLWLTTLLMTPILYLLSISFLPATFETGGIEATPFSAFLCVACGLWGGLAIGLVTERYTSYSYDHVKEVANSSQSGAATTIIYGLALGYKSCIVPVLVLSTIIYVSFTRAAMYGIALAALGMLSNLATCLTIDAYGPVCDNAGGIAEMACLEEHVREKTDALDAAGNTTAAIGKGFAIGSAALVSLALFGAFTTRVSGHAAEMSVDLLKPIVFSGLLVGAMLPYWFSAMTMKSVGEAAAEMVEEVKMQFENTPGLKEGRAKPDYQRCIIISTEASLREMVPPGLLVMLAPVVTGVFFGVEAVMGLLAGSMVSSVQLAISMSNTGGAWDNAKKFIERPGENGEAVLGGKGSNCHKAAVIGDTVGDPLKDTSGPSLNILMKLMAIISVVFADFFVSINNGQGLLMTSSNLVGLSDLADGDLSAITSNHITLP
jgi:H(+)-translocating pyrophosphatase